MSTNAHLGDLLSALLDGELTQREEPGHFARCWATDRGGWIA